MLSKRVQRGRDLKTIQIVDGADNCAYDCFLAEDELFSAIFSDTGQDIEFIEDFLVRAPDGAFDDMFERMWNRRLDKREIQGIHGTLFYELTSKKKFYPNKQESDLDGKARR
jgi:hypothetical protein